MAAVLSIMVGRLLAACDSDADFNGDSPVVEQPSDPGWLAQGSQWNSGTNGWTMARYIRSGFPKRLYKVNHGIYRTQGNCHNYQEVFFGRDVVVGSSYMICEWYWNGAIGDGHGSYGSHYGKSWIQETGHNSVAEGDSASPSDFGDPNTVHACSKIEDYDVDP